MASRYLIVGILAFLFIGVEARAGSVGNIKGEVIDSITLESIFGARVSDVTVAAIPIPGSFADDGVYFLKDIPIGLRSVEVTAPGYTSQTLTVTVFDAADSTRDFSLVFVKTLNTAEITLPIAGSATTFLLPPIVEAVQNGAVIGRTYVRNDNQYRITGIPDGTTTFRAFSGFYDVGTTTGFLGGSSTAAVTIPVSLPNAIGPRLSHIPGSVEGSVTDSGDVEVQAKIFVTVLFEGLPVLIEGPPSDMTGAYRVDLLPTGSTIVRAHANASTDLSLPKSTTIIGGEVSILDLQVFPFDPSTENFIPIIEDPSSINFNEDTSKLLAIGGYSVIDLDGDFPTGYTLYVNVGAHYTPSNVQQSSTQIAPDLDFNGSIAVPIQISDGLNTSVPAILGAAINPVDDPIVYVDFDVGSLVSNGGTGGASSPLKDVGEALNAVTPDGEILIKGTMASTESPLTINQSVMLKNDNSENQVVRIEPSSQLQERVSHYPQSGFVTRLTRPGP